MPRPGEPCSCYLVCTGDTAVVLDIGSGAFASLELAIEYGRVDAIVVSHMHADHFFDLVPFRYALKYGQSAFERRIPLWLPPSGTRSLEKLRLAVSSDAPDDFFERVFTVREYDPGGTLTVNDVGVRFQRTKHYIEGYAMRVDRDGKSITYSADTAPTDDIVEFARGSSLFLCEAALGLGEETGERGHSSAFEAGEMAARAGVERLMLTHYPSSYRADAIVSNANLAYNGPIDLAESGLELVI